MKSEDPKLTFPTDGPMKRIDFLLSRSNTQNKDSQIFSIVNGGYLGELDLNNTKSKLPLNLQMISDHLGVWVELSLHDQSTKSDEL